MILGSSLCPALSLYELFLRLRQCLFFTFRFRLVSSSSSVQLSIDNLVWIPIAFGLCRGEYVL
jgi:hypothetical protein